MAGGGPVEEIRAWASRFTDAVARKAISELLEMMTDDVVLLTASGAPVVGRDAVKALYTTLFERFDIRSTASPADFDVDVTGDIAIVSGHDSMTLTPRDGGASTTMHGRAATVLRREHGTWKLARSLSCMSPKQGT